MIFGMKHTLSLLLLAAGISWGQSQCSITQTVTTTGPQAVSTYNRPTTSGGASPCLFWVLSYSTQNATGVSIQFEGTNDLPGNSGAYKQGSHPDVSYTLLTIATGSTTTNPATGTDQGEMILCCDYYPWVRFNVTTLTGTGVSLTVRLYGYVSIGAAISGGAIGGALPQGGVPAIQMEGSPTSFAGNNTILQGILATAAPSAPVVTPVTTGAVTYGYQTTFRLATGESAPSIATVITNGNASPDNNVTLPSCSIPGMTVNVYLTADGGNSPGRLNAAPQTCGTVYNDTSASPVGAPQLPPLMDTTMGLISYPAIAAVDASRSQVVALNSRNPIEDNGVNYTGYRMGSNILSTNFNHPTRDDGQYYQLDNMFYSIYEDTNDTDMEKLVVDAELLLNGTHNANGSAAALQGNVAWVSSGHSTQVLGVSGAFSSSNGTLDTGGALGLFNAISGGSITEFDGIFDPVSISGGTHTAIYGERISGSRSGGTVVDTAGLRIDDWSVVTASGTNYNMLSQGVASSNLDEGKRLSGLFAGTGSAPGISGCSATIDATSTNAAGIITSGTSGACTVAITMANSQTAPHGFSCAVSNLTTANLIRQTVSSTGGATFAGVTVSADKIAYNCIGY